MNIAIVGGTGTVGAETARELIARGHAVRVLSRHAPEYPVDLTTGSGLARALAGVSVVVDAAQGGRYYKAKVDQEAEVARSGLPWTIVRATQFHTLVTRTFATSARLGVLPWVQAPLQPVDPREVARALAETAEAEPSLGVTQFAGPEVVCAWRGTVTFDAWLAS